MKRFKKSDVQKLSKIFVWALFALLFVSGSLYGLTSYMRVIADEVPPVPERTKKLIDNKDGTYTLSLDVVGDADKDAKKANVIVVFDTSSSMNNATNAAGYAPSNTNGTNMYGVVNGEYVALTRHTSGLGPWTSYSYTVTATGEEYTGQRYLYQNNVSRLAAAEKAVIDLAKGLLSNNTEENPDLVEIALIDFANIAEIVQAPTTSLSDFSDVVSTRTAGSRDRGTNWEAGLQKVLDVDFDDEEGSNDTTYVIFVSDGNPTFRLTQGSYNDYYGSYDGIRVYGDGQEGNTNVTRSYNAASDDARKIVDPNKYVFYTIGAYGNVDRMESLTQHAYNTTDDLEGKYYFSAADTIQLQEALNKILQDIELAGFGSVSINDGTTKNVTASSGEIEGGLIDVDTTSYKYYLSIPITNNNDGTITSGAERIKSITKNSDGTYKIVNDKNETFNSVVRVPELKDNGTEDTNVFKIEWTNTTTNNPFYPTTTPPAANLNSSNAVEWNLNELGVLYDNVKYTVTFEVWPSQATLDLIADVKNGIINHGDATTPDGKDISKVWDYIDENFRIKTNTKATLSYKDTRVENDKLHTIDYTDPNPVDSETSEVLTVAKEWNNDLDERAKQDINLGVNRDTNDGTDHKGFYKVSLKSTNNWTNTVTISTGIMTVKNGVVAIKAAGHDYSFAEDANVGYHWELKADTVHPMKVNGTLKNLILLDPEETDSDSSTFVPANVKSLANNREYVAGSDTYYKIQFADGTVKYYKVGTTGSRLTAVNDRRSYLDITKKVEGVSAPEDAEFNYSITINDTNGDDVWYSVQDANGDIVFGLNTSGTKEVPKYSLDLNDPNTTYTGDASAIAVGDIITYSYKGSESTVKITEILGDNKFNFETGSFYVASGTEFTVTMEADWNLRVFNLPSKTTYTVTEDTSSMDSGWVLKKINGKDTTNPTFSGTIEDANTDYKVEYVNEYIKTKVPVKKVWSDNSNQDGMRNAFTVTLTGKVGNSTVYTDEKTISKPEAEEDTIEFAFEDLNVYNGSTYTDENKIVYTVEETSIPSGYTREVTGDAVDGFTITNSHTPENTTLTVTKVWDDNSNQDGKRPTNGIEVTVKNGNETVVGPMRITASTTGVTTGTDDNGNETWTYTFTGLDKYKDGELITYTVTETPITDYTTNIEEDKEDDVVTGYTITNKHTPEETQLTITKIWEDNKNQDGKRPSSITVQLKNGRENYGDPITINLDDVTTGTDAEGNDTWTYTITGLPKYINGSLVSYNLTETQVTDYDEPVVLNVYDEETGKVLEGFEITNSHEIEKTFIDITKEWVDAKDQDGKRPESITVIVMNGNTEVKRVTIKADMTTVTDTNNGEKWAYRITGLDKYIGGVEANYTIKEAHDSVITGTDGPGTYADSVDGYAITNTHTPEKVSINVTKDWVDTKDQDGIRPDSITLILKNNGVLVKEIPVTADNSTVTETNLGERWAYVVSGLDKYVNGVLANYTIEEKETTVITGTDGAGTYAYDVIGNATNGYNITNRHTPETKEIEITKVWKDNKDQDGVRPDTIEVEVSKGNSVIDTITIDPTDTENVTVTETNDGANWKITVSGLDKYDNGDEIFYTVKELNPAPYQSQPAANNDEFIITNVYTPEVTTLDIVKYWDDNSDQDGIRPGSVSIQLLADGEPYGEAKVIDTQAGDTWTDQFVRLPKYKEGGKEIVYTVEEISVPTGYELEDIVELTKTEGEETVITGYKVINKHELGVTKVVVDKTWDDNDDQDGERKPYTLTLTGKTSDGYEYTETATKNADDLHHEWSGLYTHHAGKEIVYTVSETRVDGYDVPMVTGNATSGFKVTNKRTPELTAVAGKKVWSDADNLEGYRPEEITVALLADGKPYKVEGEEVKAIVTAETANEDGEWEYSFTGLPKYRDHGTEIVYSVVEDEVDKYTTTYEDINPDDDKEEKYIIINEHVPSQTEVTVTKEWENTSLEGVTNPYEHPSKVKVTLTGNVGEKTYYEETVILKEELDGSEELTEDGIYKEDGLNVGLNWTYTFTELPEFREATLINYTVSEEAVNEYDPSVENDEANPNEFTIVNTYNPGGSVTITGTKVWDDADNQDGARPDSITINLYADGEAYGDPVQVTADDNWTYTFENLPKQHDKKDIVYTLTEEVVPGYETEILPVTEGEWEDAKVTGYTITNTHTPATVSFKVYKIWTDNDNNDGKRPETITVRLLADGTEVAKTTISAENKWYYEFTDLPMYKNGEVIKYTIVEDEVPMYTRNITTPEYNKDDNSYTSEITNTHEDETIDVVITKTWDDYDDVSKIRPTEITIDLLADGSVLDTFTITKEDGWKKTIKGLPKYINGREIVYTIYEHEIAEYETKISGNMLDGFEIINHHELGRGGDDTPPQTGIINNTKKANSFVYLILMIFNILGISLKFIKNN